MVDLEEEAGWVGPEWAEAESQAAVDSQGSQPLEAAEGSRPPEAAEGSRPLEAAEGSRPLEVAEGSQLLGAVVGSQGSQLLGVVEGSQPLGVVAGTLAVEGSQLEEAVGDNLERRRGGGGEERGERKAYNYTCIPASLPGPAHLFLMCSIY